MNNIPKCTCDYDAKAVGEHARNCPFGGVGYVPPFNVVMNPSDEKLREMIVEKDGQIAQLRKVSQGYSAQLSERDAEIERLKRVNNCYYDCVGKKEANQQIAEEQEKALKIIGPILAGKDAEIARLKIDAERYRKLKPLFHKSIIMTNGRRWWDCHICTDPEIETLDAAVDALPEAQS